MAFPGGGHIQKLIMPRITQGRFDGLQLQPGFEFVQKNDGTIEGTADWDWPSWTNIPNLVGSNHPVNPRCECIASSILCLKNGKARITGSYFGLATPKTNPIINYTPNTDRDPITSHPDFFKIAGTDESPKNGAKWIRDVNGPGEFLGFVNCDPNTGRLGTDGQFTRKTLLGVEYYMVPSTMVSVTYWQNSVPALQSRMTIVSKIPGFKAPPGVKEFMLLDTPYRQVGPFYEVTELYMGSGKYGFDRDIYPQ